MEKRWTVVEVMRHARHDWLNKIQLIKGHLALNKVERVQEIINGIIGEAQQETRLTNLKAERFAELMMTYNWEPHPIFLEYEIVGGEADLSPYDEQLSEWCRRFFRLLEAQADEQAENHLCVTIEIADGRVGLFLTAAAHGGMVMPFAPASSAVSHQHRFGSCRLLSGRTN